MENDAPGARDDDSDEPEIRPKDEILRDIDNDFAEVSGQNEAAHRATVEALLDIRDALNALHDLALWGFKLVADAVRKEP